MLHSAKNTLNDTYTESNVKKMRNVSDVIKNKKPFSLLILGTDTGDLGRSDKGRTDTIIIATVNPEKKHVTLTSIPRDTEVRIAGSDNSYDKINSAYTIGGVSTAIKTVQNTLDVPIDFYLLVNMGSLRKIVDTLGGVTVTPTLTFKYSDADVTKGKKSH
jgi:cell envelope-related function transcriptional attenuator common domain